MLFLLKTAIIGLKANKTRTILTTIGVVIGITAIVVVMSAGKGLEGLLLQQVESFGTDIIETEVKVPITKKGQNKISSGIEGSSALALGVTVTTLTLEDMADIDKLDNVEKSYAGILGQEQVSYGNELRKGVLLGVSPSYIDIDKSEIAYGRFYTADEDRALSQVAVLGHGIKEKLFGDSDPLGKNIKIKKRNFKVIGVMKKRGAVGLMDFDDYIYIPVRTAQKKILGINHVLYMVHKIKDTSRSRETAENIKQVLRINHNISNPEKDDFRVVTMEEMLSILGSITDALTLLLLGIVTVSLVVGGVGVMNTMLVVISERTHEIGLRKAIGARKSDILKQFLTESIIISLAGAVIGIVLGVTISYFISFAAHSYYNINWDFVISKISIFISFVFAFFTGLVFGVYPARKAAELSPVEALRYE